jgi:hypothetical protein
MTDAPLPPYELARQRGRDDLQMHTRFLADTFGLGQGGSWSADLNEGTITISTGTGYVLTAPVQVIGTFDTDDQTWMWAWDNPSLPEAMTRDAIKVREFGRTHGVDQLTTPVFVADEDDALDFTGLAIHLAGAQGGYRGPAGRTLVLMTFGTVTARSC